MKRLLVIVLALTALACVCRAAVPEKDIVIDTLVYARPGGYPLNMYLVRPSAGQEPLPCIVFVPGSAWKKQRMGGSLKYAVPMARRGFAVACVEYRPCSVALFPAQVEDAKTAVRFLRRRAEAFRVDPANIFAWGTSSGAHTLLLLAFSQDSALMDREPADPVPCMVNAVVDFYGPTELVHEFRITKGYQENPDANGGLLLGDPVEQKRDVALKASPLYYVHPYAVPVLAVHGDADKVVPVEQTYWMKERMEECGARVESLILPGQGHGGAAFLGADVLDRCEAFIRSCMAR